MNWDESWAWDLSMIKTVLNNGSKRDNTQWRNRWGGRVPPRDFWRGNFCLRIGKKEARKKGKRGGNWEKKKENCKKGRWKIEKFEMEVGKVIKRGEDLFFFLFFFFFAFCFSFLKMTEICFGSTKMGISTGKMHFTPGKKSEKMNLPPQKNIPVTPLITPSGEIVIFAHSLKCLICIWLISDWQELKSKDP